MRFGKSKVFIILGGAEYSSCPQGFFSSPFTLSGWDSLFKRQISVNSESVLVPCWKKWARCAPKFWVTIAPFFQKSPQWESSIYISSSVLYLGLLIAEPPGTFLLNDYYYKYTINIIIITSSYTLQFRREMRFISHQYWWTPKFLPLLINWPLMPVHSRHVFLYFKSILFHLLCHYYPCRHSPPLPLLKVMWSLQIIGLSYNELGEA